MANVTVVGLAGCSASGKTTVVEQLKAAAKVVIGDDLVIHVVSCDEYYKKLESCPSFDLNSIPWPGGKIPDAFEERGNADLNSPGAVGWLKVLQHVYRLQLEAEEAFAAATKKAKDEKSAAASAAAGLSSSSPAKAAPAKVTTAALRAARRRTVILVEGLLLLADDEGAAAVRAEVSAFAVLASRPDSGAQRDLWLRKYRRAGHLGKPSYETRGVTEADYKAYWDHYVELR